MGVREGGCRTNAADADAALAAVIQRLQHDLLNPRSLGRLQARLEASAGKATREAEARREALPGRVEALRTQIATGNRRLTVVPDDMVQGLVREVVALKAELADAEGRLAAMEPAPAADPERVNRSLAVVSRLKELADRATPEQLRAALLRRPGGQGEERAEHRRRASSPRAWCMFRCGVVGAAGSCSVV
jgi:hypothetical protein